MTGLVVITAVALQLRISSFVVAFGSSCFVVNNVWLTSGPYQRCLPPAIHRPHICLADKSPRSNQLPRKRISKTEEGRNWSQFTGSTTTSTLGDVPGAM